MSLMRTIYFSKSLWDSSHTKKSGVIASPGILPLPILPLRMNKYIILYNIIIVIVRYRKYIKHKTSAVYI